MLFVKFSLEHLCLFIDHFVSKLLLVCCLRPFNVGIGWLSRWHNPRYTLRVQLLLRRLSRIIVCKHFDCHGHTLQGWNLSTHYYFARANFSIVRNFTRSCILETEPGGNERVYRIAQRGDIILEPCRNRVCHSVQLHLFVNWKVHSWRSLRQCFLRGRALIISLDFAILDNLKFQLSFHECICSGTWLTGPLELSLWILILTLFFKIDVRSISLGFHSVLFSSWISKI